MSQTSILVTDDERSIRLMLRTTLELEGYAVSEAADGCEALDAIRRHAPDLVLLDLNMPRLDGMAVLKQLKLITGAKPRVLVLTAHGSIPAAIKATRLGACGFLQKPTPPALLRDRVRQELVERPNPDASAEATNKDGARDELLDRVRELLRLARYADAEALLKKAEAQNTRASADYFNLFGVLNEAKRKWPLARRCYGKAMSTDRSFAAAELNMRRLYELNTFGRSGLPFALGDEQ